MKRIAKVAGLIAIVASVLLVAVGPADARGHGRGGIAGSHGHHGFNGHHGFHPGFRTRVFIGSGLWIGPGWGPYWYPPYYYPPAYTTPVVVEPSTYIEQAPAPQAPAASYWYYCEGAHGYYPYVQQCPGGWLTVVPPAMPGPQQ